MSDEVRNLTFNQVRAVIKLSKSEPVANEPYTAVWDATGWWDIFDRNNHLVGQTARRNFWELPAPASVGP